MPQLFVNWALGSSKTILSKRNVYLRKACILCFINFAAEILAVVVLNLVCF